MTAFPHKIGIPIAGAVKPFAILHDTIFLGLALYGKMDILTYEVDFNFVFI